MEEEEFRKAHEYGTRHGVVSKLRAALNRSSMVKNPDSM